MIKSINFRIKHWQYNNRIPMIKLHTDCLFKAHPLKNNTSIENQGLAFLWVLTITGDGLEILHYSSEEMFFIPDKKINDVQLMNIIRQSYNKANHEVSMKNAQAGLNAAFPPFNGVPIDLPEIRKVLDM